MPTIWPYISKFKLKNWEEYNIERNDIIVFVWTNNCWKSTFLKEIDWAYMTTNKTESYKIIEKIDIKRDETDTEFKELIISKSQKKIDLNWNSHYEWFWFSIIGGRLEEFYEWWKNKYEMFHDVFSINLKTTDRLILTNSTNRKKSDEVAKNLYDIFSDDLQKFKIVKRFFDKEFGKKLSFDLLFQDIDLSFKVSDLDLLTCSQEDWNFKTYKSLYQEAWNIYDQWDWMKSYTWIISTLIAWEKNTYFIDEPESFLHPPQAFHLWQQIWELSEWQIFIATHSQDFIKWLLKANSDRVKIFRILRNVNNCSLIEINKDELNEIQNDAFLHYSNFLDSLFNNHTIVCEDQSDCLFYNRIMDIVLKELGQQDMSINFVYTWWKERFPRIYKLLKKRWIKFTIIGDIDVLNSFDLLSHIFWGNISEINEDYETFQEFIQNNVWTISVKWAELKERINDIFTDEETITKNDKKRLEKFFEELKKPWDQFKISWKYIFWEVTPEYFNRIINFMEENHVFLVPFWEMENFIPEFEERKKEFVYRVILLDSHDEKLNEVKEFIWRIVNQM